MLCTSLRYSFMRNDDPKFHAMAKRLIRAGVPLDIPVKNPKPPVMVKAIADYHVCEIFGTSSGDTAVVVNLMVVFSKKTFVEEVSLELPWDAQVDDWLEPKPHPKSGPNYGFSSGTRYPAKMVLNDRLSGSVSAGTVLKGLLLGISYSHIPEHLQSNDTVIAQLRIFCAPEAVICHPIRMIISRRITQVRATPAPRRREPLFGLENSAPPRNLPAPERSTDPTLQED
jgi:hypothetical protein